MDLQDLSFSRVLLLGCGLAFLLVGVGAVVLLMTTDDLLVRALERMEQRVETRLPEDLSEEERTRLHWAFQEAAAAVGRGSHDNDALTRAQEHLATAVRRPPEERLSREKVEELTVALEAVAGGER